MSKLINNEFTVRPFVPKLLPGLIKIHKQVANPKARSVAAKAIATICQVAKLKESDNGANLAPVKLTDPTAFATSISVQYKTLGANPVPGAVHPSIQYATCLTINLIAACNFDVPTWELWEAALVPYLEIVTVSPKPASIARKLYSAKTGCYPERSRAPMCTPETPGGSTSSTSSLHSVFAELLRSANKANDEQGDNDDEEGEDLCNCQFSLAYGAKILLNTANLRLKRSHRYGLCGRNGSGKSTLMCAITNSQVEGFPLPDEVLTFYVKHNIDGSHEETSVLQFILNNKRILCDKKEASRPSSRSASTRSAKDTADILLLDEPTNHLDIVNIAWLEGYLTLRKTCTLIIVSHNSGFLNNTITDVFHLNHFKIKRYHGNLEALVKTVPEAKSYYTLEAAEGNKFKIPDPPLLEGLYNITLQVSLSSRVTILGPDGSGKLTLVKLLIGDLKANKASEVWKHPNLVIGYVVQHAFHHIDHHLDKTPLEPPRKKEEKKMKEGGVVVVEGVKRLQVINLTRLWLA
ncbi:unnamed protein product [Rhizoctonia solani]|uniref:AAA+ ATPase domain-containing protein n=1 Tax=Rhizoctonia solani TaxID=456999 RepID=A0A8H3BMT1_9AGAM|nr:unnamed protein product [Rhizoctonia solani]